MTQSTQPPDATRVSRERIGHAESLAAQRRWWDLEAVPYYAEHGAFLGDRNFVWGPEGWTEDELRLLAPAGLTPREPVLEIGSGAAQCARWLRNQGVAALASDLSAGMLSRARDIDGEHADALPLIQCDGARLPFADASFGTVFTAYGVLPFVADSARVVREVARVLVPGGRFVFSTTHPIRWVFPDEPGPAGLQAQQSYWDTRPYVERDHRGRVTYVEHHRTLGERIREIVAAGLVVSDLLEPTWPERNEQEWGGWSPLRGSVIPGTAIFVCDKPAVSDTPRASDTQQTYRGSAQPGCADPRTTAPNGGAPMPFPASPSPPVPCPWSR